eukprot:14075486-Alexandrium_andersonii.AAC.1
MLSSAAGWQVAASTIAVASGRGCRSVVQHFVSAAQLVVCRHFDLLGWLIYLWTVSSFDSLHPQ